MPPNIFQFDPHKVQEIVTLGMENDSHAQELLNQAARQVQPIIRKRQWVVPKLSEFYPNNPNLLGLNIGGGAGQTKEIKIRLRKAGSIHDFFPYEHILGTMLHELSHNIHGPHNAAFYKLLDELTTECEELMAKGIAGTGQGFDAPSVGRLGSYSYIPQHNPPPTELRQTMIKAAEERAKRLRLSAGPQKLGGDGSTARHLTPAQAATQAAERRLRDNLWCPTEQLQDSDSGPQGPSGSMQHTRAPTASASHTPAQLNHPQTVAAKAQHKPQDVAGPSTSSQAAPSKAVTAAVQTQPGTSSAVSIDLTMSDDDETPQPSARPPLADLHANTATALLQQPGGTRPKKPSQLRAAMRWCCPICTLFNQPVVEACDACMAPRPATPSQTTQPSVSAASQPAQPSASAASKSTQPSGAATAQSTRQSAAATSQGIQPSSAATSQSTQSSAEQSHRAPRGASSSKRQLPAGSQHPSSQSTAAGQSTRPSLPPSANNGATVARTTTAAAAAAAAERRLGVGAAPQPGGPVGFGISLGWACLTCTLRNSATCGCCDACGAPRGTLGAALGIAP